MMTTTFNFPAEEEIVCITKKDNCKQHRPLSWCELFVTLVVILIWKKPINPMKDQVMTKIWYILNFINQQRNEQLSCTKKWLCKAYFCPYFLLCTCSTWIFVVVLFVSLLTKCLKFQTWTIWIIWGGLLRKVYICYFWNVQSLNSEHGLMRYVWHCSKYYIKGLLFTYLKSRMEMQQQHPF